MNFHGLVKGIGEKLGLGDNPQVGISQFGGLYTDLTVGLPMAAAAKADRVFGATVATGTEIIPVQAVPTTAAAWFLFNDEPDDGRNYYIDRIACWSVSSTLLGLGMSLLACVTLKRQAIGPSAYSGSILTSLTGGKLDTKAILDQDTAITGGTPAWINVASRSQLATQEVGSGLVAEVKGAFMVKPGHGLGMTVLAPTGTAAKFSVSVVWVEI